MDEDAVDRMVARWRAERPDLEVSSMGILARISLAYRLWARLLEREYARAGLNSASFDVLAMLRQVGAPFRLTPTQLYTSLRVSSGTMTNRIDQLERVGMVVRAPDPNDRRGLLVELTPKGLETVDALVAGHAALGQSLADALPPAEQESLANNLRKLIGAMEEADQEKPAHPDELIKPYMRQPSIHKSD
ncbi:MAG TPA: MarR family transcriptional regulator [Chloroflexota bacterium]|nr:MarR family transcriptional regulator [Chloroflexota bacterium]